MLDVAVNCPVLSASKSTFSYSDPAGSVYGPRQQGSFATFTCAEGYAKKGSVARKCVNGAWTGSPQSCETGKAMLEIE